MSWNRQKESRWVDNFDRERLVYVGRSKVRGLIHFLCESFLSLSANQSREQHLLREKNALAMEQPRDEFAQAVNSLPLDHFDDLNALQLVRGQVPTTTFLHRLKVASDNAKAAEGMKQLADSMELSTIEKVARLKILKEKLNSFYRKLRVAISWQMLFGVVDAALLIWIAADMAHLKLLKFTLDFSNALALLCSFSAVGVFCILIRVLENLLDPKLGRERIVWGLLFVVEVVGVVFVRTNEIAGANSSFEIAGANSSLPVGILSIMMVVGCAYEVVAWKMKAVAIKAEIESMLEDIRGLETETNADRAKITLIRARAIATKHEFESLVDELENFHKNLIARKLAFADAVRKHELISQAVLDRAGIWYDILEKIRPRRAVGKSSGILRKAAVVASVIAMVLLFLGFASCTRPRDLDVVLLCDRSTSAQAVACNEELIQNVGESWIEQMQNRDNGSFAVDLVGDSLEIYPLFSEQYPDFANSPEPLTKAMARYRKDMLARLSEKIRSMPESGGSNLFSALFVASRLLADKTGERKIILASDLRNVSEGINMEKAENLQPDRILATLEKQGLTPRLGGIDVIVCGFKANFANAPETTPPSAASITDIETIWTKLLVKWGAKRVRIYAECNSSVFADFFQPSRAEGAGK